MENIFCYSLSFIIVQVAGKEKTKQLRSLTYINKSCVEENKVYQFWSQSHTNLLQDHLSSSSFIKSQLNLPKDLGEGEK